MRISSDCLMQHVFKTSGLLLWYTAREREGSEGGIEDYKKRDEDCQTARQPDSQRGEERERDKEKECGSRP